ncbi:MAG: response regulator [Oscillospiraceae bacterium]|jgi:PleD family two-component response regulator|nr:response regulator [Oscillospiraceae bacterium]
MRKKTDTRRPCILAVDDAAVSLHVISAALSDTYQVIALTKPTMLEEVLRNITPELFLLDYKMPEMSGFDLIPVIRSFEQHRETPIIMLTALGTMEKVSSAVGYGACDIITKPFEPGLLRERIARQLKKSV